MNSNTIRRERGPLLDALRDAGADVARPNSMRCPFHDDANPSAGIYADAGVWRFKCHGCGFGGDVFDVRARLSGRSVADELRSAMPNGPPQNAGPARQRGTPASSDRASYPPTNPTANAAPDWAREAEAFAAAMTDEQRATLAAELGVSVDALAGVGVGWASEADLRRLNASGAGWRENYPSGAYAFAERGGAGVVIGLTFRAADGRKGAPSGARRGLIIPATLADAPDPVLIVEGASDVAACLTLGLAAVGRPSNTGGAAHLAELLDGRAVLVVGERDQKGGGKWPGRDGAKAIAGELAAEWGEPVRWTLPPAGVKDVRDWLRTRVRDGLDLGDGAACRAAGAELLGALDARARQGKRKRSASDAELIVRLAEEHFRLGCATDGQPFAVRRAGPNVALLFRGSTDALRATLARDYRAIHRRTPSASALADALTTLQGIALDAPREAVALRVTEHDGGIVIDLGGENGSAVVVGPDGWRVEQVSPVLFRRTALTAALPEPERGGGIDELRALLNVTEDSWPVLLGWLVAAFVPAIPHPILMLGGQQGAGKTTAATFLAGLFDPSTIENHNVPRDPEAWAMAANGSWGVVVDNVSCVSEWWSDALCKAVTGSGWARRMLYTDSTLAVLNFRRVVILTSIDAGALRGDLGDRLLIADLEPIPDTRRRAESDLRKLYAERRPSMLGALLDVVARVLAVLPDVRLESAPRMADFARILAAVDRALGTDALALYVAQRGRIAEDVVAGDPVGEAIVALVGEHGAWTGSAGELLAAIRPKDAAPPRGWPRTPRAMGGRLRRLAPALRQVGVEVIPPAEDDKTRTYALRTARTAQPPGIGPGVAENADAAWAVGDPRPPDRPADRPDETALGAGENAAFGRSGGMGGRMHQPSGDGVTADPAPPERCHCCGRSRWWRPAGDRGGWTCGACHKPAGEAEWSGG